jgi:hypothetical protein
LLLQLLSLPVKKKLQRTKRIMLPHILSRSKGQAKDDTFCRS